MRCGQAWPEHSQGERWGSPGLRWGGCTQHVNQGFRGKFSLLDLKCGWGDVSFALLLDVGKDLRLWKLLENKFTFLALSLSNLFFSN